MGSIFRLPFASSSSNFSRSQNLLNIALEECQKSSTPEYPILRLMDCIRDQIADGCAMILLSVDDPPTDCQLCDRELVNWLQHEYKGLLQAPYGMIAGYSEQRNTAYLVASLNHFSPLLKNSKLPCLVLWRLECLFYMDDAIALRIALNLFSKVTRVTLPIENEFTVLPALPLADEIDADRATRAVLNAVNDAVFLIDPEGNLKWHNSNAYELIHGAIQEVLQSLEWHWLVQISHPDDAYNILSWTKITIKTCAKSFKTFRFLVSNEKHSFFYCSLSKVKASSSGEQSLWILALTALSPLEKESVFSESQGALVRCISSQVQDLRIPLTLSLELLPKIYRGLENTEVGEYIRTLQSNLSQMSMTLNGTLLMNDKSAAFIPPRKVPICIEQMIDDCIVQKHVQFGEINVLVLANTLDSDFPAIVLLDDLRVRQTFTNILTHICGSIEHGTEVTIDLNKKNNGTFNCLHFLFTYRNREGRISRVDLEMAKKLARIVGGSLNETRDQLSTRISISLRVPIEENLTCVEDEQVPCRQSFIDSLRTFKGSLTQAEDIDICLCIHRIGLREHIKKLLSPLQGLTLKYCDLNSDSIIQPEHRSILIVEKADSELATWVKDRPGMNFSPSYTRFICLLDGETDYSLQDLSMTLLPPPYLDKLFLRAFQEAFIRMSICVVNREQGMTTSRPPMGKVAVNCPMRIMVAEDNLTNLHVLVKTLNKMGYEDIIAAQDGRKAFDLYISESQGGRHVDLIFMDMQMPVLDGCSASLKIRQWIMDNLEYRKERYLPTHIIALTARPFQEDRQVCLRSGMCRFASKPIQWEFLEQLLEEAYAAIARKFICRCQNLAMAAW